VSSPAPFLLKATRIQANQARLNVLTNTLSFQSATIEGMHIARTADGHTMSIASGGVVKVGQTKIQTTVLRNLASIGSFRNKRDVLLLLAGSTLPHLELSRVEFTIDGYLTTSHADIPVMTLSMT